MPPREHPFQHAWQGLRQAVARIWSADQSPAGTPAGRRRALWLGACLAAPLLAWLLLPVLVRREVTGVVEPDARTTSWSMRWRASPSSPEQGVWLLPGATAGVAEPISVRQVLPVYSLQELWLDWESAPRLQVAVREFRVRFSTWGFELFDRQVRLEPGTDLEGADGAYSAVGPHPRLRLVAHLSAGWPLFVMSTALAGLGMAATWYFCVGLGRLARTLATSPVAAGVAVGCAIALVGVWLVLTVPVFITNDGLGYLLGADSLIAEHSLEHFPSNKVPAMSFLLAGGMMLFGDYFSVIAWYHLVLGSLCSLMAYHLLRDRTGWRPAMAAALIVGLHPVLLTYRFYILREVSAAAILLGVGLALSRLETLTARQPERPHPLWQVVVAVLCGLGALFRENFQLLLLCVPPMLLWINRSHIPLGRRVGRAGFVAALAFACILPWALHNYSRYDHFGLVTPKLNYNRVLSLWNNGITDGNSVAVFSEEEYRSAWQAHAASPLTDFQFLSRLCVGPAAESYDASRGPMENVLALDREAGLLAREAVAREPLLAIRSSAIAFANQLGLWNFSRERGAPENAWWARTLRGKNSETGTNMLVRFRPGRHGRPPGMSARLWSMLQWTTRSIDDIQEAAWTDRFEEWFHAFQAVRPMFALLFIAGLVIAIRRSDAALLGIGSVVVFLLLAAAIAVATPVDRFGVPFIPVVVCLAVYAISTWRLPGVVPDRRPLAP